MNIEITSETTFETAIIESLIKSEGYTQGNPNLTRIVIAYNKTLIKCYSHDFTRH
jgi:hypothetical protein